MTGRRDESGFSLVELMVAILLLSILSVGFYQVMFSAVRGSQDASDIAEVAEEARLGFNRMIRDTRETTELISASGSTYRIWTDYNRNKVVDENDYEHLEYAYNADDELLTLTALAAPSDNIDPVTFTGTEPTLTGTSTETLAAHVQLLGTRPVFSYASNFLQYDTAPVDGEVSATELDTAAGLGNNSGTVDGLELDYVSDVNYAFRVSIDGNGRTFYGQAQIRNRRYSNL